MSDLEKNLEELERVKQSFKSKITNTGISTNNVEFRNMPELINQMEKKLPSQTKNINPTTSEQVVNADSGYKLTQVNVKAVNPSDYYKPEQSVSVSPKTITQTITPSGNNVYNRVDVGAVTSAIDNNIKSSNIKKGVSILGVTGTLEEGTTTTINLQEKTINPTTSRQSVTADGGYDGLSKVNVEAVIPSDYYKPEEIANVTPTTNAQVITPTANSVFNKVNVSAVTSAIDENIKAENIKKDVTILGVAGTLEEGGGELAGYNVESIVSEDGASQTLKITSGGGTTEGGEEVIQETYVGTDIANYYAKIRELMISGKLLHVKIDVLSNITFTGILYKTYGANANGVTNVSKNTNGTYKLSAGNVLICKPTVVQNNGYVMLSTGRGTNPASISISTTAMNYKYSQIYMSEHDLDFILYDCNSIFPLENITVEVIYFE